MVDVRMTSKSAASRWLSFVRVVGRSASIPTNATACANFRLSHIFYRKKQGESGFTKIGSVVRKGVWVPAAGACSLSVTSSSGVTNLFAFQPSTGTDTYRIAVRATIGTVAQKVLVDLL